MLYRVIILDSRSRADQLARTITTGSKPAAFYSTCVKVICFTLLEQVDITLNRELPIILLAVTGLSSLAMWDSTSNDYLESRFMPIIQSLRLRRLSCEFALIQASLEHPIISPPSHLRHLTHLEVILRDFVPLPWDALQSLTHISIYRIHDKTFRPFLDNFVPCLPDSLRICIIFFPSAACFLPELPHALEVSDQRVLLAVVDADRDDDSLPFKFLRDNHILIQHDALDDFRKSWGRLPEGELDMWDKAEAILATRNANRVTVSV